MSAKVLAIDLIKTDGGTQMRAELSVDVYMDYRDKILAGVEFPPLDVFFDGSEYWLADGFHRFYGHREAKRGSVKAIVHNGTVRDAILFAVGANDGHGLRRNKLDKRNAISTLLNDGEWCKWSNGVVAEKCKVTPQYVGEIRRELETVSSSPAAKTKDEPKIGKDGKSRKAPKKTTGTDFGTRSPAEPAVKQYNDSFDTETFGDKPKNGSVKQDFNDANVDELFKKLTRAFDDRKEIKGGDWKKYKAAKDALEVTFQAWKAIKNA